MPSPAHSTHSTSTVDQISIDMNSAGNGTPAVGDRDGDGVVDAEGGADDVNGLVGVCGNGLDDDTGDFNGSTVIGDAAGEIDGSPDDGCQVLLSTRETCREIMDDGVLSAGEDATDRLFVDVTVGAQPGPGGGVPSDRNMSAFQFALIWSVDIIEAPAANAAFLIHSAGTSQPYFVIYLTDAYGPPPGVTLAVADGVGPVDSGAGILGRITVDGKAAGFADLTLGQADVYPVELPVIYDDFNEEIPIDVINGAQIAVSKDGPDAGTTVGDSTGELFTCDDRDADGIPNASDSCPAQPEDVDGFQDEDGCPDDNDGDGILDNVDACPQLPGVPERMGCPVPAVGGLTGLLYGAASEPGAARLPSEDERGSHAFTFALVGISVALLAGSALAVRLRRRARPRG